MVSPSNFIIPNSTHQSDSPFSMMKIFPTFAVSTLAVARTQSRRALCAILPWMSERFCHTAWFLFMCMFGTVADMHLVFLGSFGEYIWEWDLWFERLGVADCWWTAGRSCLERVWAWDTYSLTLGPGFASDIVLSRNIVKWIKSSLRHCIIFDM